MRERVALDVGHLSPHEHGNKSPLWWGFLGLLFIEGTVFAILIASYFYLRMGNPAWPPETFEYPELLLPTINTLVLLASSVAMARADHHVRRGNQRGLALGINIGIVLAVIFLILKAVEYHDYPYRWDTNAYGSIVWAIIGFHSAHVTVLVLKTIIVDVLAWRGYFNQERRLGVTVNGLYWHFVVVVWIPLYLVLYWSPRLL